MESHQNSEGIIYHHLRELKTILLFGKIVECYCPLMGRYFAQKLSNHRTHPVSARAVWSSVCPGVSPGQYISGRVLLQLLQHADQHLCRPLPPARVHRQTVGAQCRLQPSREQLRRTAHRRRQSAGCHTEHGRERRRDYFTNKVYAVGKSGSPRDVTQENPLRLSE